MTSPHELWDGVLRRLGGDLPAFALEAWLRPLALEAEGDGLRLLVPDAVSPGARSRALPHADRGACSPSRPGASWSSRSRWRAAGAARPRPSAAAERRQARGVAAARAAQRPPAPAAARRSARFRTRSTASWSGPATRSRARRRSRSAQDRQQRLNPLFLVSEPGLGKTHLARAIVAEARRCGSERAVYTSAEGFTSDFMTAIRGEAHGAVQAALPPGLRAAGDRGRAVPRLARRRRSSSSSTRSSTCSTRARAWCSRPTACRGAATASSRGCARRWRRAGGGARASATRACAAEILRAKASAGGVGVPDDCLDLLVEGARGSVRDLEGVLIQLVAMASLLKRPIDLELTEAALRKLAAPEPRGRLDATDRDPHGRALLRDGAGGARGALAAPGRAGPAPARDVPLPPLHGACRWSEIARAFDRDHPAVSNAVQGRGAPDPGARAAALPGRGALGAARSTRSAAARSVDQRRRDRGARRPPAPARAASASGRRARARAWARARAGPAPDRRSAQDLVGGAALDRRAADLADQPAHLLGRQVLAEVRRPTRG